MSFQYPYIEHYSPTPATPLDTLAPQRWDVQDDAAQLISPASYEQSIIQHQQQDNQQLHSQITQQQESEPPTATLAPAEAQNASPSSYEPPQVIQLVERPLRRVRQQAASSQSQAQNSSQAFCHNQKRTQAHSQAQPQSHNQSQAYSSTSSNLNTQAHTPSHRHQRALSSVPPPGHWFDMHDLAKAKSDKKPATATATTRTQARLATHPYRRTVSGPESIGVNTTSLKTQMRVSKNSVMAGGNVFSLQDQTNSSLPTPSSATSTTTPAPAPTSTSTTEPQRYLIRTDVHYSAVTNTVTAMLELPGVKRAHVRVGLNVCPRTHITQLVVRGRSQPLLPDDSTEAGVEDSNYNVDSAEGKKKVVGYIVRERKVGEFKRVLVVPPETKPDHIQISMEDGIMFVRYPAGSQDSDSAPTN